MDGFQLADLAFNQATNQKNISICLGEHMCMLGQSSRPFPSCQALLPASEVKESLLSCLMNSYGALVSHSCFLHDPFFHLLL